LRIRSGGDEKSGPKVLFMMNCFKGQAAGECYYQLARELVRSGCRVTVLLPQDRDTPAEEVMDGIEVRRFSYFWPQRLHRVAYGLGLPENLKKSWLARFQFPFFILAFLVRGLALARRADLVHVFTTSPAPAGGLARLWWGKPFVLTVIGSDVRLGPRWFNRLLLKLPHRIISATKEQDEILHALGRRDGLRDIKHLIDFTRFDPDSSAWAGYRSEVRREFALPPEAFVATFVGRLYDFKDPLTFIRAAALVRGQAERARFLLVGHGEQSDQAAQLIRELGLGKIMIMTGSRGDVHRLLAASDCFCTLSPIENCFAATILEAMTARLPVILTDAGYTAEAFPHLKCAYLVPPRNPEALAQAILSIMTDDDLRRRLSAAGPDCLRRLGFDRDRVVERTRALYQEVLGESRRGF